MAAPLADEEDTDLLARVVSARRWVFVGSLTGVVVGILVIAGVTYLGQTRWRVVAPATLAALDGEVTAMGNTLDEVARTAHERADRIAANSMVRAAIFTDAATVGDMLNSDFELTPIKDEKLIKGDTLELFQHEGTRSTSLVRWPKDAAAIRPLHGRETRLEGDRRGGLDVVVSSPVERYKEGEGYRAGVTGTIALSIPVDLTIGRQPLGNLDIAVWGSAVTELDDLVKIVRDSGGWGIVPIHWPETPVPSNLRANAHAHLLHSGHGNDGPCEELLSLLAGRPAHIPLIVVGDTPSNEAKPSLWMPTAPSPMLLASVIEQLLGGAKEPVAAPLSWRRKTDMIIGNSPQIQQLLHSLDQLAPSPTPVIVTGESGVGKELVARALHFCGPRAKAPFIAINCAAVPENLFEAELFGYQRGAFTGAVNAHTGALEAADKGTLFLDEIGDMPLTMQAKLLRVLETSTVQRIGSTEAKKVNFRLVSATNRKLEREVKEGRFREDLYYRIQVYPLHVPPLRERPEDIPPIVTHHLSLIGMRENRPGLRVTSAALEKLVAYGWPGNVRQLVNLLERAALLAGGNLIEAIHIVMPRATSQSEIPVLASSLVPYRDAKTKFEREYYSQLMRAADGNVSLAAKIGQKTRKEIYDALKRLGLDASGFRDDD